MERIHPLFTLTLKKWPSSSSYSAYCLWLAALAALLRRRIAAPALGYLGLLCLSFAKDGNLPLLPISPSILWGWLAMTAVVTMAVLLQPSAVRDGTEARDT